MNDTTTITLTSRFQTIITRCYTGSVSSDENRAAHGGVCITQCRRTASGQILARQVNINGRHTEVGESYEITDAEFRQMLLAIA